ncbi:hypothetical protein TTHT_0665 [Thermotomaculum hydrothermale]|uniref:histidine kinase n=1 Tax=Thermotomaculum hydrothermale TaxID=981385 RepID=A0A7R6PX18_9BACT|nr:hypothetical protein [Thermotomaculum hydrothermale]BBB32240.1 hypothetical protein TTHT_0665 [Thermotomaculum hydrothermale]
MFNLLLNLAKSFPFSLLVLDKNGNIEFMNKSAELFLNHFNIPSISITNYRDLKPYFPNLCLYIENYYTNIFTGNQSKYGIEFSKDYIADVTLVPYFENGEFKNLSIIIEDKTAHYKKIQAYNINSKFLKDVIEIKDLVTGNSKFLFDRTLTLLKNISGQKKILFTFGENNPYEEFFYTGFNKNDVQELLKSEKLLSFILDNEASEKFNLVDNIYFFPNNILLDLGINLEFNDKNTLICAILKNKKTPFGAIFIEFNQNIIPYITMIEQLSLFMQFAPLIFGNYEKTKTLIAQKNFIQSVINNLPQNIFVCNNNFEVELINKVGKNNFNPPEQKTHLSEVIGEDLFFKIIDVYNKKTKTGEIKFNNKHYTVTISKTKFGKHTNLLIVISDITEIKKLENEVREKEKLETIKSLSVTAHDRINNPLTVISTKLDIMETYLEKNMLDKEKTTKIIKSLKKQIDRISTTLTKLNSMESIQLAKYANMENIKQIILKEPKEKID